MKTNSYCRCCLWYNDDSEDVCDRPIKNVTARKKTGDKNESKITTMSIVRMKNPQSRQTNLNQSNVILKINTKKFPANSSLQQIAGFCLH